MSIFDSFKQARLTMGISQEALAKVIGTTQSTIDRIERGVSPNSRYIPSIAAYLKVGIPEGSEGSRIFRVYVDDGVEKERDSEPLEVYTTINHNKGYFQVFTAVHTVERRINALRGINGAFGFLVEGYEMEPAYEPLDIAMVHPHLGLVRDCDVLVCKDRRPSEEFPYLEVFEATMGRLVSWNDREWRLKRWISASGDPGDYTLSREEWPHAMRIVGKANRI